MEQQKVCCFCERWESGGIESFLTNVLLHMELKELQVEIVATEIRPSVFTAKLKAHGIHFVQLSGRQQNLVQNHRMFRELVRKRRYDVIHFNLFQGLSLQYVHIAKQEGVPVRIAHSHNTALRKSRTRWVKLLLHRLGVRLYTGDATNLWACSNVAAEFLFDAKVRERKGYCFIANGIETERFQFRAKVRESIRKELGLSDSFVIGNVGRLCNQKNQSFLLDIFVEFERTNPNSSLLLVGEGENEQELKDKALRLAIERKVIFYGVSNRIDELLCAMDVFVFPSIFEGLGIVAIEAQASGIRVLASENVPQEAAVSDLFCKMGSTNLAKDWANEIGKQRNVVRENYANVIKNAGFNISDVANKIQEMYLGKMI